jgi:hypothetical protein
MSNVWFYSQWALALGLIPFHLTIAKEPRWWSQRLMALLAGVSLVGAINLSSRSNVPLHDTALILVWYSGALFVLLSEMLMGGIAAWLTKKRGEQWTKEIEYVYLSFAGFGVVASLGKLETFLKRWILSPAC